MTVNLKCTRLLDPSPAQPRQVPPITIPSSETLISHLQSIHGPLSQDSRHRGARIFLRPRRSPFAVGKADEHDDSNHPITLLGPISPLLNLSGTLLASSTLPPHDDDDAGSRPAGPPWVDIDLGTASLLVPALRLVTRILTTPNLTDWWAWALFGRRLPPPQPFEGSTAPEKPPAPVIERFDLGSSVEERERWFNAVQAVLREHANRLRIRFDVEVQASRGGMGASTASRQIIRGSTASAFQGRGPSVVLLSRKFREFAQRENLRRVGLAGRKRFYFSLAVTVLHELAHSIVDAREGPRLPGKTVESYIGEEDAGPEFGFSLENFLFGGTFFNVDNDHCGQSGIMIGDWLAGQSKFMYTYVAGQAVVGIDSAFKSQEGLKSIVPQTWIEKLFQASFWERIDASSPKEARALLNTPRTSRRAWIQRTYDSFF